MATDFSMTARDMVAAAMREIGILGGTGTATAEELQDCIVRLNAMLKSWGSRGLIPWTYAEGTASITGGDPDVVLTPRPVDVTEARIVVSGEDRPLTRWGQGEYALIRSKATAGTPTLFSLKVTPEEVALRVYPVPASGMTLKYGYTRAIEDVTDPSDVVDIPQMWLETAYINLAARLPTMFGTTRVDPAAVADVQKRAADLEAYMMAHDRPASYRVGQNA